MVCGINDGCIQGRLLAEADLMSKTAFTLAQEMEAAERNALELQATSSKQIPAIKAQVMQENLRR